LLTYDQNVKVGIVTNSASLISGEEDEAEAELTLSLKIGRIWGIPF